MCQNLLNFLPAAKSIRREDVFYNLDCILDVLRAVIAEYSFIDCPLTLFGIAQIEPGQIATANSIRFALETVRQAP